MEPENSFFTYNEQNNNNSFLKLLRILRIFFGIWDVLDSSRESERDEEREREREQRSLVANCNYTVSFFDLWATRVTVWQTL